MRRACDFAIDRFVMKPPPGDLRTLLRLGAYQLLFAGVPAHAAVNDTVAVAPGRSKAFVNAILRRVASTPVDWPDVATRLSYPDWIVARLTAELDDDAVTALERMNERRPSPLAPTATCRTLASQWVADLVDARPGDRMADLCAAPGGKATRLAADGAIVVAADLRPARARLIAENAARLGATGLSVVVADGTAPPLRDGSFDRVAGRRTVLRPRARCGAGPTPGGACSRPTSPSWPSCSAHLLAAARPLVRPGGILVYSVCTLTAAESIDLDDGSWPVLPPPPAPWRPYGRGARLLPQDADTDGMTVLRYVREP